jgi:heme exporter protein C
MWWKLLGALIFIYVLIGGLTTPLRPGIEDVSPYNLKAGTKTAIKLRGYNTNFSSAKDNHIWIKLGDNKFIKASDPKSLDNNTIEAMIGVPPNTESKTFTVITYNELDGYTVTPDAIYIDTNSTNIDTLISDFQTSLGIVVKNPDKLMFPYRSILNETIRNTFFHVALWMAMFALFVVANYYAIKYLISKDREYDFRSEAYTKTGVLYGILGLITGSLWARYTWGTWWTNDVKLNMAAIAMIIYIGYIILRASINDMDKRARISAVFSIFSFVTLIPLIFIIPRLNSSLHPGNGGNPALGGEDLDNTLRMFFYPSIIALFLLGLWISQLKYRYEKIKFKILTKS